MDDPSYISLHEEDRPHRVRRAKPSGFPSGLLLFILLLLVGAIGFLLYDHHTKLSRVQDWLSGDADNLEQVGSQLLQRTNALAEDIKVKERTLKTTLEKNNQAIKKITSNISRQASANRKKNQAQDAALTEIQAVFKTQDASISQLITHLASTTVSTEAQALQISKLESNTHDLITAQDSIDSFRRTTNGILADHNQQSALLRKRIEDVEQRLAKNERLLIKMKRLIEQHIKEQHSRAKPSPAK